jgi:hypothetical protein
MALRENSQANPMEGKMKKSILFSVACALLSLIVVPAMASERMVLAEHYTNTG